MTTIKTILVTTDFSESSKKAFPLARALANRFQAKIILIHSLEDRLPPLVFEFSPGSFEEMVRLQKEKSRERLAEFGQELGKDTERELANGPSHLEIVRIAEQRKADLIVMATHGHGFFSQAFLGSTTERVLRRAPCPVLIVRDVR